MGVRRLSIGFIVAVGLLAQIGWVWPMRDRITHGYNDFLAFYAGGKLAFSGHLYDQDRVMAVQAASTGRFGENTHFIRFPWFAAMLGPIAWLPYQTAYALWFGANVAGLGYFLAAWRPGSATPATNLMLTAFFIPLAFALGMGQDIALLLSLMAAAVALARRERPGFAGLLLALCQAKIHVFFPLFILLAAGRRWRMLSGLAVGNVALALFSLAVAGPAWPMEFVRSISSGAATPGGQDLPTLYPLVHALPHWEAAYVMLVLASLALAWYIGRRASVEITIAAAPALALPLLNHTYIYDCALLAPLCIAAIHSTGAVPRVFAFFLLLPLPYLAAISGAPWSWIVPLATTGLLASLASAHTRPKAEFESLERSPSRALAEFAR